MPLTLATVDAIVDTMHRLRAVVADEQRTTTTADLYDAAVAFVDACDQVPDAHRTATIGVPTTRTVDLTAPEVAA